MLNKHVRISTRLYGNQSKIYTQLVFEHRVLCTRDLKYVHWPEIKVTDCHGIKGNAQQDSHAKVCEATYHLLALCIVSRKTQSLNAVKSTVHVYVAHVQCHVLVYMHSGTSNKGHSRLRTQYKKTSLSRTRFLASNYTFKPLKGGNLPIKFRTIKDKPTDSKVPLLRDFTDMFVLNCPKFNREVSSFQRF